MRSNSSVWARAFENASYFSITMDQHQTEAMISPMMTTFTTG